MCTTMIITRGATADGSMVVTHSDDDELADQRVIHVPAADHAPGSRRQVMKEDYPYPRFVTDQRGPGYDTAGWPRSEPIGSVPEVEHTYAYFDGNYGIMNEHNLMMGECGDRRGRGGQPGAGGRDHHRFQHALRQGPARVLVDALGSARRQVLRRLHQPRPERPRERDRRRLPGDLAGQDELRRRPADLRHEGVALSAPACST